MNKLNYTPLKSDNFTVEIDRVDEETYSSYLDLFDDAVLYQTWSYGKHYPGGRNLSHIILKRNGEVLAIAQARILLFPFLNRGIAYIFHGPVWKRKGPIPDKKILSGILNAINEEYSMKRKLLIRIVPRLWNIEFEGVFNDSGYFRSEGYKSRKTILVDLKPSLSEIRNRFLHKWRNRLNVAERNGLEVLYGNSFDLFRKFKNIYKEMLSIKDIPVISDIDNFMEIQNSLPEKHKMNLLIAVSQEGRAVAGLVLTHIGSTGICLLAAANSEGRELLGTYLLQWEAIRRLKETGLEAYDLGGIDKEENPGGYHFKAGLGGKEIEFLGRYESCRSLSSRIIVSTGEYLRKRKKRL